MKKLVNLLTVIGLTLYVPLVINPECGVGITTPSPVGGTWKFAFTYTNGESFGNCIVYVSGSSICGKINVEDTGEEFYVTGYCEGNYNSMVTGRFADTCNGFVSYGSSISGTLDEITGAGYGSGSFSFTQKNPNYKGTWQAKRNH